MREVIEAGKLRQYVTIERYVMTGVGDRRQPIGGWQALYENVPAEIKGLSGRQAEIARQLVANASHTITIRHHADVTPKMRVVWKGRTFNVGAAGDGDYRDRYMVLTCTEQVDGAT